ncbi:MAG: Chromosome segregation protein [Pseudomonadota bacterium]|nr:Chromosome segregation protein [Pseudomonadota bacterium]
MLNEEQEQISNNFIKYIELENYKSIKKLGLDLTNLNVLIGANGAGKSNLISFFSFLQQMLKENLRAYVADKGGQDAFLYYGSKVSKYIAANLQLTDDGRFGNEDEIIHYSFKLFPTVQNIFRFDNEEVRCGDYYTSNLCSDEFEYYKYNNEYETHLVGLYPIEYEGDMGDLSEEQWLKGFIQENFDYVQVFHFHDTSDTSPIKQPVADNDNLYLRSDGANVAAIIKLIHDTYPDYYRLLLDTVRMVVPDFHDFVNREGSFISLEWFNKNNVDIPWKAYYLSDGSLRFITLATLLLMPAKLQPHTIIIDEPELGLHPSAIHILSGLIKRASQERQVIISTQSPTLLSNFNLENIIVVDKHGKSSEFKRLNKEELAVWMEDFTLPQLWEMNILGGRP